MLYFQVQFWAALAWENIYLSLPHTWASRASVCPISSLARCMAFSAAACAFRASSSACFTVSAVFFCTLRPVPSETRHIDESDCPVMYPSLPLCPIFNPTPNKSYITFPLLFPFITTYYPTYLTLPEFPLPLLHPLFHPELTLPASLSLSLPRQTYLALLASCSSISALRTSPWVCSRMASTLDRLLTRSLISSARWRICWGEAGMDSSRTRFATVSMLSGSAPSSAELQHQHSNQHSSTNLLFVIKDHTRLYTNCQIN